MREDEELARFERAILPHLDAASNLARWLTRNDHDAEDVVQCRSSSEPLDETADPGIRHALAWPP